MADERIDIEIADKVSPSIRTKIEGIADASDRAHLAVTRLKAELSSINATGLRQLQNALNANTNALSRNAIQQQRLATETQKTQRAANLAAAAQQRITTASNQAATAAQRLATEQRRTAAAALAAQAAQDRAALAALRLQRANAGGAVAANAHGNAVVRMARNVAAVVGLGLTAKAIIDAGDAYTVLQNKLRTVTDTEAQLAVVTNEVFEIANRTRAPVLETAQAFSRFDLAMKGLGASQKESLELTETVNKALALGGATVSEQAAGLLQLSQAFNKGKLDGDEFRTVMELMPAVADAIAKKLGVARGELLKLAPKGKITAQVLRDAFADAREEISERFAKTIPTVAQSFQILRNNAIQTFGEFSKATGLTAALATGIMFLSQHMTALAGTVAVLGVALLVAFGPTLYSALARATTAVLGFTASLATNPVGLLLIGLAAAGVAFAAFKDDVKTSADGVVTLGDSGRAAAQLLGEALSDAADYAVEVWESATETLSELFDGSGTSLGNAFDSVLPFVKTVANQIIGFWVATFKAITELWKRFPELIGELFARAVNFGISALQFLINSSLTGLNAVISVANFVAKLVGQEPIAEAVQVNLSAYKQQITDTSGDVASFIKTEFENALSTDYIGDAVTAIQTRARELANERLKVQPGLRPEGPAAKVSQDPDKAAIKRALALKKINDELDREVSRMRLLRPERDAQQRMDEIENSLLGRKITLTDKERNSIRAKIDLIEQEKIIQSQLDKIYEGAIGPARDFAAAKTALNRLAEVGAISFEQYQRALQLATNEFEAATDPMIAINRELQQQSDLLKFLGPEQIVQQQLQQVLNTLRGQGIILSQSETAALAERLRTIQRETDVNRELNRVYDESLGARQNLKDRVTATNQAFQLGLINLDNYTLRLQKLGLEAVNLKLKMGEGTFEDAVTAGLGKLVEGYEGVLSGLSDTFGTFFSNITDGFANSIGRGIVYAENLGDALGNAARSGLAELISGLVKLGLQWLVNATLGTTIAASTTAASAAAAGATAAAWAPAASMVSLASFGANSAPAMAGIAATNALATTLASIGSFLGFESGGFTGNMGTKDIAGVVHGQEYVVNAAGTARNRDALEAMNRGATFVRSNGERGGKTKGVNVVIQNYGTSKAFDSEQIDADTVRIIARDEAKTAVAKHAPTVVANQMGDPNSPVSKSMARNTKAERRR